MVIGYTVEASKTIIADRELVSLRGFQDDLNNGVFGVDTDGKRYWRGDVKFSGSVRAGDNGTLELDYEIRLADGEPGDIPFWYDYGVQDEARSLG